MSVVLLARPLDGRYDDMNVSITIGDEVAPIPPDEYGNGFDGGMMPSGTETYVQQLVDGKWHQETMPMSYTDAVAVMNKRLGEKGILPEVGAEVTNKDGDFVYTIKELAGELGQNVLLV